MSTLPLLETIEVETADPARHDQLKFAARTLVDALSPAHFPLTNPLVMQRAIESRGDSLVKGMEHLLADREELKKITQ